MTAWDLFLRLCEPLRAQEDVKMREVLLLEENGDRVPVTAFWDVDDALVIGREATIEGT